MSASRLPAVIEYPDGRREVELTKGCRLQWWRTGDRWTLEIRSEQLLDFIVDRRINQIRWAAQ